MTQRTAKKDSSSLLEGLWERVDPSVLWNSFLSCKEGDHQSKVHHIYLSPGWGEETIYVQLLCGHVLPLREAHHYLATHLYTPLLPQNSIVRKRQKKTL